jgi:peptidoglycan/xylan/chitin deacetylase (PgdA/CDA1 family)
MRNVVFLMYHELELPGRPPSQPDPGYIRYVLPQAAFLSQMSWLIRNGWNGLSVSQALRYPAAGSVAITFDDGCETDLIAAAPVIKDCGFNATFYATAGFLGRAGHLTAAQLRVLSDSGFEIGCHSMTHAYLDELSDGPLHREISDAKKELENITGKGVDHFSCPGGRFNRRVLEIARESGYVSLATSRPKANSSTTNVFMLGRVAIMRDTDEMRFGQICCGAALWKVQFGGTLREGLRGVLGNSLYDRLRARLLHP